MLKKMRKKSKLLTAVLAAPLAISICLIIICIGVYNSFETKAYSDYIISTDRYTYACYDAYTGFYSQMKEIDDTGVLYKKLDESGIYFVLCEDVKKVMSNKTVDINESSKIIASCTDSQDTITSIKNVYLKSVNSYSSAYYKEAKRRGRRYVGFILILGIFVGSLSVAFMYIVNKWKHRATRMTGKTIIASASATLVLTPLLTNLKVGNKLFRVFVFSRVWQIEFLCIVMGIIGFLIFYYSLKQRKKA